MSYRIRSVFILILVVVPHTAFALTPCKSGLAGITFFYGAHNPPGSMPPDTESIKQTGKWPDNLVQQGWHNLRKLERPLRIVYRYKDGPAETIFLPESTNTCILTPGLTVTCE
jgi:hypothetical protein